MFKLNLEKAEEPEINLPTSAGSLKKQESSRKTSTSALLNMPKPLTVWITTNCGKLLEMGIPDHLACLLRNLYAGQEATVRTGHGTMDWFKLGKEYVKAVYSHPAYLTYMQSTSCETPGWMKHKLESRSLEEILITSDIQMTPPFLQKVKRLFSSSSFYAIRVVLSTYLRLLIFLLAICTIYLVYKLNKQGDNIYP